MSNPSILFVVDAGPAVGGGHVMRSLTLAGVLEAQGASCRFVAPPAAAAILAAFAPEQAQAPAASTAPRDLADAVAGETYAAIVFDHYGLSAGDHRTMAQGQPALVIDDLADRPLGGGLIPDSGPARPAGDYAGLVDEAAGLVLGPPCARV